MIVIIVTKFECMYLGNNYFFFLNKQVILAGSAYWTCDEGSCGSCASSILQMKENEKATYGDLLEEYTILRDDFGSTKLDRSLVRISCHSTEQMWFDIMRSYGDVGRFLSVFSLFGIVLYFVTSSDSGSLVIDCLSANGNTLSVIRQLRNIITFCSNLHFISFLVQNIPQAISKSTL